VATAPIADALAIAWTTHSNWRHSEADLRELRKSVTFAVYAEEDDLDQVTLVADRLLSHLAKTLLRTEKVHWREARIRAVLCCSLLVAVIKFKAQEVFTPVAPFVLQTN
jgi:hypothetical protein